MLLHVARAVLILLEVLILFNLLIVVHELGHFLAARWRGLYIEKFGVWFGKPIWKKTVNGVQYSLGSLPFGGFVALPQLAPMDIIEGKADMDRAKLPKISALDKIIVAVAGPVFHGNERQHQLGRRAERGRQDCGEIPARRQGANRVGRALQSGDPRLAEKKCAAAAHLSGRNADHRESRTKKPCSGSRTAP